MIVCASSQSPGPNTSRSLSTLTSPDTPVTCTVTLAVGSVANATVYVAVCPSATVSLEPLNTRLGSFSRIDTTRSARKPPILGRTRRPVRQRHVGILRAVVVVRRHDRHGLRNVELARRKHQAGPVEAQISGDAADGNGHVRRRRRLQCNPVTRPIRPPSPSVRPASPVLPVCRRLPVRSSHRRRARRAGPPPAWSRSP